MAELAGLTFRFAMPTSEIIDTFLPRTPPAARKAILDYIEPILAERDRQVEDALTRALACTCGSH